MKNGVHDFSANRRGFTLIEIMVVVTIIIVLMGILIPSINKIFGTTNKAAASAQLGAIRAGLQTYYAEFHMFPPSAPSYGGIMANRGSAMLAQGLMGYLPGSADGAGTDMGDSAYGFRIRKSAMGGGPVYGPFVPPDQTTLKKSNTNDQCFIDPWGNEILYYCSTLPTNPTSIFGTSGSYYFNSNDCKTDATPPTGNSAFFNLINGNNSNSPSGTVTGATSYLLISAGPGGVYFDSDDVVLGNQ